MANLPFVNKSEDIYENLSEGILVAISGEENSKIIDFQKKNKGKKKLPSTKVKGYRFVLDEEFDSLKIDFSVEVDFIIKDLKLFPFK
jgi:hypothetical protein